MSIEGSEPSSHLLCRAGSLVVAISAEQVHETMRPLPVSQLPDVPSFVLGIAVIRGVPTPVIDVPALLGSKGSLTRFITVRSGERRVAMAFDEVLDVRNLSGVVLETLPSVATVAERDYVESVGVLDTSLLLVLKAAHVVPDSVWVSIQRSEEAE